MENAKTINTSVIKRLVDRIGNPLDWSTVDKCLLIICCWILIAPVISLLLHQFINHPERAPFLNLLVIKKILPIGWGFGIAWSILLVIGLLLRHRRPENMMFAYVTVLLWWSEEAIAAICIGPLTTPAAMMLLGQGFVAFLLFRIPIVLVSLGFAMLVVVGSTIASYYGFFSYAPVMAGPLYDDGRITNIWALFFGSLYLISYFGFLSLSAYIINRWRNRESRLADLTTMLKKMFGRYLSTEVMDSLIKNPAALELGGEKREVTIMMTDLRGFTAIAERFEPEKVVRMLNLYFEVMVEVVLKYNGTINEIIGDALLVIFGAPQKMEDQTERAIACSIEMQNAMAAVNHENRSKDLPNLEMGIGINKAEVIVGNIGSSKRSKYTVVGSGVNMTSRIESYTTGGQILISESVLKESVNKLRIDGEQKVYPKGADTPLRIYEVGGIANPYNLVLRDEDSDLVALQKTVPFQYSFLGGKHIKKENMNGTIKSLSDKSAEAELDVSADLMTNIKICLISFKDEINTKDIYGKIIDHTESGNYVIRFTAVPPEISSYFHAFRIHALKHN